MNNGTEEAKARQLYGKARDQTRSLNTPAWHELPAALTALLTRLVRLAVVEAIHGGNAIRRDVLEYWAVAAQRASRTSGCEFRVTVEPDGLCVSCTGPYGVAALLVSYAELMSAITPKGAVDEIISHLLAQIRPAPLAGEGVTFNGGH